MSNEPDDAETDSIALIKRTCESCGAEAVPLEGIGTPCENCSDGEYTARSGVYVAAVSPKVAEEYREAYPDAIAEGE